MLAIITVDSPREKLEALQFMAEWPSLADGLNSGEFALCPVLVYVVSFSHWHTHTDCVEDLSHLIAL